MGTSAVNQITNSNDVQVIREILFGEQSQHIQENFARLDELISALQQENQQLRQALDAERKTREKENQARIKQIDETQTGILAQIDSLREQFKGNLEQLSGTSQEAIAGLERSTDARFQEMQKEQAQQIEALRDKHQVDMKRLVGLLAAALADYQGQNT